MEILIDRIRKGANSILSAICVESAQIGYVVEDKDRGLSQRMSAKEIAAVKVKGRTAIPEGRYRVLVTYSMRFKKLLPILINVPGFSGIRIHTGNTHLNTEGCLLPGTKYTIRNREYEVLNSRILFNDLFPKIQAALRAKSEVWITIKSSYEN